LGAVDLVTLGEAFEDLVFLDLPRLPRPGEEIKTDRFLRTPGGGALITAVAASRLGTRCRVVSALGEGAVALLRGEGVGVRNLRREGEAHALTAALSTKRDRSFVTYSGVNDRLEPRLAAALRDESHQKKRARHVHFAFYPRDCGRWALAVARLRGLGVATSWDFGWNEGLTRDPGFPALASAVDYLFLNEVEASLYARRRSLARAIEHWREKARNAVIKLGPRGSRWVSLSIDVSAPAPPVRVVDTTGAGDAFDGGFLHALLNGAAPAACLKAGNRMGALSTRGAGGLAGLPRARTTR
jgi:sugar/nucleoside kinase (ribokinase family)